MKVRQVNSRELIVGEPYFLNADGTNKMIFVCYFEGDLSRVYFYPLDDHQYGEDDDGTVGFASPTVWEEEDEEV